MLHGQDLSTYLWEESTSTTMYIHNRIMHVVLDEKTPEEVFIGEKLGITSSYTWISCVYSHTKIKENQDGTFWR